MKKFDSSDGLSVACCSGVIRWPPELTSQSKAKRRHRLAFKLGKIETDRQRGEEEKETELAIDSKALKSEELPESTDTWWWDGTGDSFTDISVLSLDRVSPGVSDWIDDGKDPGRSPGTIIFGGRDSDERIEIPDQLKACRYFPAKPGPVLENVKGSHLEEENLEGRWKIRASTVMNQENRRQNLIVVDDDYLCAESADDRYHYHHRRHRRHHHRHRRQQLHQLQQCQDNRGLCHSVKNKLQLNGVNDKVQRVGAVKDLLHQLDPHPPNVNGRAIGKTQRASQTSHLRAASQNEDRPSLALNYADSCFCCMNSVFIYHAARGNFEMVLGLLESPGLRLSVNTRDCLHGNTALHLASANGHSRLIRELIMRGANASLQNQLGETCLHTAAKCGRNKCVRVLLNRGCNPLWKEKRYGDTVLHTAVRYGHSKVIQTLLTACSCITDRRNLFGETALDIALSQSDKDEVVKLIVKFSRLEAKENKQNTKVDAGGG